MLLKRRQVLAGVGSTLLAGCNVVGLDTRRTPAQAPALQLARLRASIDRITAITVCTRPFRPQGPRVEIEPFPPGKLVVHNYGHGGSGWSLSWGSSSLAVARALSTGERDIAVIGCGALGLTSSLLLQRAGARVTVYAKELPPNVRSSLATGLWTPDSRICMEEYATPNFKQAWAAMARESFRTYQTLLGLPGNPVEYIDQYFVSDQPHAPRREGAANEDGRPKFAELQREMIPELMTRPEDFAPGDHSLGNHYLQRTSLMMFNISAYARMLLSDFLANGGQIEIREFHSPADFAQLRQRTLINATGYGARALFGDESLVPVRGQLARMIPQPDINYGLYYKQVSFVPRRDDLVFQVVGPDDYYGFNDDTAVPNHAEAQQAVNTIAELFPTTVS